MADHAHSDDPAVQAQLDRFAQLSPGRDILGLERIERLLALLDNPHLDLPPVFHVAGTNGKGSTCAFLRTALEAAGRRVHAYTSPHLVRFNERIRVAGNLITDEALAPLLAEVLDAAEADGMAPSFFEATTAAAFLAFSRTKADVAIIEVGLGGRLDATNIIPKPLICGIAQLGIDRDDPDYAALSLGNQILGGGGFGTRLMSEVREKRGLAYGVYSGFTPMQARGPFMINLQTRAEMSEGTLKLVQDVLADYLKTGPTQKELDDAKRELAGSFPLSTASNADIVGQLGAMGFYNLPLSYLNDFMRESQSLTVEQVKAALNKHLSTDKMVIVSAGPTVPQKPLPAPTDKPAEQPLGVPEH